MNTEVSRRSFMKLSASSAAAISVGASTTLMTGCARQPDNSLGLTFLTKDDADFIEAIAPVVLNKSYPASLSPEDAGERLVKAVDALINTLGEHSKTQLSQLFTLMSSAPLRLAVGAPFASWPDASAEDVESFLVSWRNSMMGIKNMGYASLCKILSICWYSQPETFALSGYPGLPKKIPTPVS
ncbi:twin-arginine translocation signal domain-containing protein [Bacterioplanoides sp.]|uniref:twin-arginine translocation signal domain-containing protein n=1 Tax=Bacterioplanoides sp. TaxID=2066072 RepID=UPI003AFFFFEB